MYVLFDIAAKKERVCENVISLIAKAVWSVNNKASGSLLDKKNCQFRANWISNWNYRVCNQTCNVALVFIPHSQSFILYFLPFRLLILLAKKRVFFFNSQEMAQSFSFFIFNSR
jgi:hypothetical protein